MKIVICGSINFPEKIKEIEKQLVEKGHDVVIPYGVEKYDVKNYSEAESLKQKDDYVKNVKPELTIKHFDEIKNSDAILVVNVEKRGIPNYIGGATFAEIMFAFYHKKKIFLLNPIPTHEKTDFFREEIECTQPVVINGNLGLIK
ncbi:MAG: hypothetical protein JSW41_02575 [Candidatus Aenigmatarchaeota archaeon]|nr:MAG: hypothetical protein JSW41_02575 [Candidatus Aenigmarchaeota archaeon]